MTRVAAVGVYDNLSAGKSCVTDRAADNEPACGVDKNLCIIVKQIFGDNGLDYVFNNVSPDLLKCNILVVLSGHNNGVDPDRLVAVVFNGNLGFSVGTEIGESAVFSDLGKSF